MARIPEVPSADWQSNTSAPEVQDAVPKLLVTDRAQRRDSLLSFNRASPSKGVSKASVAETKDHSIRITFPVRACTCLNCAPHLYLQTIHAHEIQNFRRSTSNLAFLQHESLQLAHVAIASFQPSFLNRNDVPSRIIAAPTAPSRLTFGQHHAVQQWKHWLRDLWVHSVRKSPNLSEHDASLVFRIPINVFNQLFFLGQLPNPNAKLQVLWSPPGTKRRAHSHTFDNGHSKIWINPYYPAHFLNLKALMDTLLHELCHIFLQRHSCYLGGALGCDRNQVCVELCQQNYGVTGHGRAWLLLAAAIEHAAPGLLGTQWRMDLGREECAVQEMIAPQSGWWPSACDLRHVASRFHWRLRVLIRSRDDDAVAFKKARMWVARARRCPSRRGRRNSI